MSTLKNWLSRVGLLGPARTMRRAGVDGLRRSLHPLRERLVRIPYPSHYFDSGKELHPSLRANLRELRESGITRVRGRIAPAQLEALQRDFGTFVRRVATQGPSTAAYDGDITVAPEYADPRNRMYASNEPFAISRTLVEICLDSALTGLIDCYLGKRGYITQGVAIRIEPSQETGYGSFQWHHDAWGKRINMMIILTEVGESDQHMTYAKGSHRLHHPYEKYVNSRFSADEFAANCGGMEVLKCVAQPGDIYVFDSNGIHSGNRTGGRTRDTFIIEYTRQAQAVWAHTVPAEFLHGFDEAQREPFRWILREDRRGRPLPPARNSWVDQMFRVHEWLR
jgi:hypothetical protein